MKPTASENLHFARQDAEQSGHVAKERKAKLLEEQRERDRIRHFMKCPMCEMKL